MLQVIKAAFLDGDLGALDRAAEKRGISRSALIREIVKNWLRRERR